MKKRRCRGWLGPLTPILRTWLAHADAHRASAPPSQLADPFSSLYPFSCGVPTIGLPLLSRGP
eukprot:703897-Rhodomonas_salina.2